MHFLISVEDFLESEDRDLPEGEASLITSSFEGDELPISDEEVEKNKATRKQPPRNAGLPPRLAKSFSIEDGLRRPNVNPKAKLKSATNLIKGIKDAGKKLFTNQQKTNGNYIHPFLLQT